MIARGSRRLTVSTRLVAVLNLGPCSMLPPHWHPRASNFVYAVHGTTATFMISENGAGVVKQTLTPGKMTIFPHASLHMMMNIGKSFPSLPISVPDSSSLLFHLLLAPTVPASSLVRRSTIRLVSCASCRKCPYHGIRSHLHFHTCTYTFRTNHKHHPPVQLMKQSNPKSQLIFSIPGCTNAQLVSALNAEDTGTLNLGYGLQNLQELLVNAAMGYQPLSTNSSRAAIPLVGTGSNFGPKECLAKCAAQTGAESAGVGGTEGAQCGPPVPRTAGEAEVDAGNLFDIGV